MFGASVGLWLPHSAPRIVHGDRSRRVMVALHELSSDRSRVVTLCVHQLLRRPVDDPPPFGSLREVLGRFARGLPGRGRCSPRGRPLVVSGTACRYAACRGRNVRCCAYHFGDHLRAYHGVRERDAAKVAYEVSLGNWVEVGLVEATGRVAIDVWLESPLL